MEATIEKIYPISTCLADLDADTVTKLKDNELHENVCMWGATPGSSNVDRWEKLKEGDGILAYSKGEFKFFGTILLRLITQMWLEKFRKQTIMMKLGNTSILLRN